MGFADELRNAPNTAREQQQQEELQREKDWVYLLKVFVDDIKEECRYMASKGKRQCYISLGDWLEQIDEKCAEKYQESDYIGWINSIEFNDNIDGQWWQRMRDLFFHYVCGNKYDNEQYLYPFYKGMSKTNAMKLSADVKKQLEEEGLVVEETISKEYCRVHYSRGKEIIDEWRYLFSLTISW